MIITDEYDNKLNSNSKTQFNRTHLTETILKYRFIHLTRSGIIRRMKNNPSNYIIIHPWVSPWQFSACGWSGGENEAQSTMRWRRKWSPIALLPISLAMALLLRTDPTASWAHGSVFPVTLITKNWIQIFIAVMLGHGLGFWSTMLMVLGHLEIWRAQFTECNANWFRSLILFPDFINRLLAFVMVYRVGGKISEKMAPISSYFAASLPSFFFFSWLVDFVSKSTGR